MGTYWWFCVWVSHRENVWETKKDEQTTKLSLIAFTDRISIIAMIFYLIINMLLMFKDLIE
jgi:hypothetical protein